MAERKIINGYIVERAPDGTLTTIGPANQGPQPITIGRQDPTAAYDVPKVQADLDNTRSTMADRNADNARADRALAANLATQPYDVRKAAADADKAELEAAKARDSNGAPQFTAVQRGDALQAQSDATALLRAADELERLYEAGPGATSGIGGMQDYLPTSQNKIFDDAGQQSRAYVKRALGFTGGEGNTVAESAALYNPYLPNTSDRDEQIVAKIAKLRGLAADSQQLASVILGEEAPPQRPNAMTANRIGSANTPGAAGAGATSTTEQLPPEMQAEYGAFLGQWMQNPDPQAYAQFRTQLDEKYGYPVDPDKHLAWANNTIERMRGGGATVDPTIPGPERDLSGVEQAVNDAANNPLGTAVAGASDALSLGAVGTLNPEGFAAINDANPVSGTLGQMAGAIGGVGGIAALGARTLGKAAPKLLGGGSRAQFGRNMAADATYGAGYGSVTESDPLTGAVLGAAGSAGGQVIGKGLGTAIGGAKLGEAAQSLANRGIPLTGGQRLGGIATRIEDKAMSVPLVGDMIRNRRMEGIDAFNRSAFEEAGAPTGTMPTATGREGIEQLQQGVSQSYNDAVGMNPAPLDRQFMRDLVPVRQMAKNMTPQGRGQLGDTLRDAVQVPADAGQITGSQYQDAMSALASLRGNAQGAMPNATNTLRNATVQVQDALTGAVQRNGGQDAVDALGRANAGNRNLSILKDASLDRAKVGTQADAVNTFTPAQLLQSARKSEKKYGDTPALRQLGEQGQEVLPSSIPDSGTAGRLAAMALPGAAGLGLGGGAGFAAGGVDGAQTGAGLSATAMALAALGGTRGGQRAIGSMLNSRPQVAQNIAGRINRRRGMFGSATLPFMVMQ